MLADSEDPLEIVAGPVAAKSGKQARRTPIAVDKGVNVDQLKLRDAGRED